MRNRALLLAVAIAVLAGATDAGAAAPPAPVVLGCNSGNAAIIQDAMTGVSKNTTIQLAGSCTYTITSPLGASGLPPVKVGLTIVGAAGTIIDGNNGPTPFLIQ